MPRTSARSAIAILAAGLLFVPLLIPRSEAISSLHGSVVDDAGPVAGAIVRYKGGTGETRSDANGQFRLPIPRETATVTAAREGYFIGSASSREIPLTVRLKRIPDRDDTTYAWIAPEPSRVARDNCGNCHRQIFDEWNASGHSRSATGRHFTNLYDGTDWHGTANRGWNLLKEHPDGAGVCASCHAPGLAPNAADDFDLRAAARGHGMLAGVHCDFCHKVRGPGGGEWGLAHGKYQLQLIRPAPGSGQLFFGPLRDVDRGDDAFSLFQKDARLCAACHEGNVFGVPVYSTYSEWLKSPARDRGQTCQSCHMAATGSMTNFAPGRGGIERLPQTLANHRFFAPDRATMLRNAIRLQVRSERLPNAIRVNIELEATGAGHALPTGFIDRQLILIVENGRLLSGPRLPKSVGEGFAARPGVLFAKSLADRNGNRPAAFWNADLDSLQDTRLQPEKPYQVSFQFEPGTAEIRVRLIARRFWAEVANEKHWPNDDIIVCEKQVDGS